MASSFARLLLQWHDKNPRPLPWDEDPRDPYHIWVSEIIMQQTRIEQGAPYYTRFVDRFPSVVILASASQDEVLRYWQGLGYYTRARNLHKAAQEIVNELNGKFPATFNDLKRLPGIGDYTAAAIASFAFGLPHPVVDGNVKRVLSRFCGFTNSVDESSSHQKLVSIAADLMQDASPAKFNQAIMNFGALVCTPKNAICQTCPLSQKCFAYKNDCVEDLPVRSKKKTNKHRYFHFITVEWRGRFLFQKREQKDIWNGLFTPLLIETKSTRKPSSKAILAAIAKHIGTEKVRHISSSDTIKQLLSHQTIHGRFHRYTLLEKPGRLKSGFVWVTKKRVDEYPKPKMVVETVSSEG